jgi:hypothetical protein
MAKKTVIAALLKAGRPDLANAVAGTGNETRTYEVTGDSASLDELERILSYMDRLGGAGASRAIHVFYDGDGAARLSFKRTDKKVEMKAPPKETLDQSPGGEYKFSDGDYRTGIGG